MIAFLEQLFRRRQPVLAEAGFREAGALARLHGEAFRRGWSEPEFERLLLDRQVLAHCARRGREVAGFIMSRRAADEAEILSVAVAAARRGRGLARGLLDLHLRRLAGLAVKRVFLEVEDDNTPALRLYRRAGFREVGRREQYYPRGTEARPASALVLRRDLA
jgi:ribosomal-protein-alanine N-acetyltransferase